MTDQSLLFAYIAAATVLAMTPGVDTAFVISAAITSDRRAAFMASLGICLGCLAWGVGVCLGLGALLQTSPTAYTALKYAGALYLLWLGIGLLLRPRAVVEVEGELKRNRGGYRLFASGLKINLLNPKVGIFYVTFLPQFVPASADVASYSLLLASIHVFLSMLWFFCLIVVTSPLCKFLKNPATVKTLDRLTGGIFVMFAAKLAS